MNLENMIVSEKQSVIKDHIWDDAIYMKYPEEASLQKQTVV